VPTAISEMLTYLGDTDYAAWVRESLWGWPMALTFHAFGTAIVIGLIFIIGLRLSGMFRTIPYASLSGLFPVIWIGIVCQIASGVSLWMTKPSRYTGDTMFDSKFSLVVISITVTVFFQRMIKRNSASWQAAGTVPSGAVRFAAYMALLWAGVLVAGRLTAYLGTLYMS
jgi:hypothetical protein